MSVALELIAVAPAATCLFIYTLVCALVMAGAQIFFARPLLQHFCRTSHYGARPTAAAIFSSPRSSTSQPHL